MKNRSGDNLILSADSTSECKKMRKNGHPTGRKWAKGLSYF